MVSSKRSVLHNSGSLCSVVSAVSAAGKGVITKPGERVTLGCGSRRSFKSLAWYHGSDLILSVNGKSGTNRKGTAKIQPRSKVKQGSDLEISGVKKEDAGNFICTLDGDSHTITLLVVSVSTSPPDELQLGREGTLQCEVAGLPPDSIVQWTRPDGRSDSGTVHFNPLTLADKGQWVCGFSYDGDTYNEIFDIKIKGKTLCFYQVTTNCNVTQKNLWQEHVEVLQTDVHQTSNAPYQLSITLVSTQMCYILSSIFL
ncbi:T-cell surface glycoprotein CD4-2 [Solea senegalensis]|uniref:T-cell surface glycoprotein CD4-2 n=1 Tax=Solea senegalensis TaxID=28829 RepID=A0AAV6PF27_SOLSE|nr:T-cell surface glycoprotein CD4-2 [Solea senegalensis]